MTCDGILRGWPLAPPRWGRERKRGLKRWGREPQLEPRRQYEDESEAAAAIARDRPTSIDALARISGVGQSKLTRYGADVLEVVRAH